MEQTIRTISIVGKIHQSIFFNENRIYAQTNLNGGYSLTINSPEQQSSYFLSSNFYYFPFDGGNSNEDDLLFVKEKITRISFSTSASTRNLFYFQSPLFLEIGPTISYGYSRYINRSSEEDENRDPLSDYYYKNSYNSINAALEIGAGYGRIEPIIDAQMALFILNDLKKENRLAKEPTHEEIYKLAEIISTNRNKRFFDNRQKVIDDIKAIDSYLIANGIVSQADAAYFTTIYDNWQYANNPFRESGFRVSMGPSVGYFLSSSFFERESNNYVFDIQDFLESENKVNQVLLGAWAKLRYEKPINLTWQRSLSAAINYHWGNAVTRNNDDPETEKEQSDFTAEFAIAWGYYPNTRTYVDLEINIGGQINKSDRYYALPDDTNVDKVDYKNVYVSPRLSGYYYFSPQLRLNLNTSLNYNFYKTDNFSLISPPFTGFGYGYINANRLSMNFLIGINYAFF